MGAWACIRHGPEPLACARGQRCHLLWPWELRRLTRRPPCLAQGSTINNKLSPWLEKEFSHAQADSDMNCSTGSEGGLDYDSDFGTDYDAQSADGAAQSGVPETLFFGAFVCCFSLASAIILFCLDRCVVECRFWVLDCRVS